MSDKNKRFKVFQTADNTVSYTSGILYFDPHDNQTSVFQANMNSGDTLVLKGRIDESLPFVNILTVKGCDIIQEVVTVSEYQVVVTNTSGSAVVAAITI
jgi:hypothetical protein